MEQEKRVLVTNEDDISVGNMLELVRCGFCGATHRFLVLRIAPKKERPTYSRYGLTVEDCKAFYISPMYGCVPSPKEGNLLDLAICERRLYRIEIGLSKEANPYVAKTKQKESVK